jgi:hypothetical protein
MQPSRPKEDPLHVAIVSRNSGTLDGLETYLQGAGVTTHGTRRIERSAVVGAGASALVVFPDDFSWGAVVSALTESRRRNPRALPLVITCSPQRFEALTWRDEGAIPLLVPKPAWGWTILDAIRAHRHEQSAPESGP